jgi:hypothetical protein
MRRHVSQIKPEKGNMARCMSQADKVTAYSCTGWSIFRGKPKKALYCRSYPLFFYKNKYTDHISDGKKR